MKKIIIVFIIIGATSACKKNMTPLADSPTKYYFKIEAVDNDGTTIQTAYKVITVN